MLGLIGMQAQYFCFQSQKLEIGAFHLLERIHIDTEKINTPTVHR